MGPIVPKVSVLQAAKHIVWTTRDRRKTTTSGSRPTMSRTDKTTWEVLVSGRPKGERAPLPNSLCGIAMAVGRRHRWHWCSISRHRLNLIDHSIVGNYVGAADKPWRTVTLRPTGLIRDSE